MQCSHLDDVAWILLFFFASYIEYCVGVFMINYLLVLFLHLFQYFVNLHLPYPILSLIVITYWFTCFYINTAKTAYKLTKKLIFPVSGIYSVA